MSNFSNSRFIKFICSPEADDLQENYPNAFLLLVQIAKTARRTSNNLDGLEIGDSIVGELETSKKAGLSKKEYRNALEKLENLGIIETVFNPKVTKPQKRAIKRAIKSKIVNLKLSNIWDINPDLTDDQKGDLRANRGRTKGDKQERIRKNKKEEEECVIENPNTHTNFSFEKVIGLDFSPKPVEVLSDLGCENRQTKVCLENLPPENDDFQKINITYNIGHENVTHSNKEPSKTNKKPKPIKPQVQKIAFRDDVHLSQDEYDKLLSSHGKDALEWMLNKLSYHKGSKGATYKSDYLAILNWVVDAYNEHKAKNPKIQTVDKFEENKKLAIFYEKEFFSKFYTIEILSKQIEFIPKQGQAPPEILTFSSNGFKEQLENILRKRSFIKKNRNEGRLN